MKGLFFLLLCCCGVVQAQELYPLTEPASGMPFRSVSARFNSALASPYGLLYQRYGVEGMAGVQKALMLHGGVSFSNWYSNGVRPEGASLYAKYRFYSRDAVHSHFRMAAYAQGGYSRNPMYYDEVMAGSDMSGVGGGIIATGLRGKWALSTTLGYMAVFPPKGKHQSHRPEINGAYNGSLSTGYLLFPRTYKSYDQLGLNLYAELLAQRSTGNKTYFVDFAPAIQIVVKSNTRINLSYRRQLDGTAFRNYKRGAVLGVEHTWYNALKRRKAKG